MGTCALCGKEFKYTRLSQYASYEFAFLERGLSKKYYLCNECYKNKVAILDYAGSEMQRESAINTMQKLTESKSSIIQDIVRTWIEGENRSFYSNLKDLVYNVNGPNASLFVFKDHLVVLSAFDEESYDYGPTDKVLFYKRKVNQYGEIKNAFFNLESARRMNDIDILMGSEKLDDYLIGANTSVELEVSIGEFGVLEFSTEDIRHSRNIHNFSFQFFYHQNQLMEEIYNYIQKRMENPDAEDNDVIQSVDNAKKTSHKQEETKSESNAVAFSPADEIRKMKELFDCGILSQEEFDEAKKRLISKL